MDGELRLSIPPDLLPAVGVAGAVAVVIAMWQAVRAMRGQPGAEWPLWLAVAVWVGVGVLARQQAGWSLADCFLAGAGAGAVVLVVGWLHGFGEDAESI